MLDFKIIAKDKKARTGVFETAHGKLKTPNLAIVATHGKIKSLTKEEEKKANPDLAIANTFHLFVNNKVKEIKKAGGIHKWGKFRNPVMTDSGGFQVFSLGWGAVHGIGKIGKGVSIKDNKSNPVLISENGAVFTYDDKKYELTPESSMKIQKDIGADIIFAFDECTSPLHSKTYTEKAMKRTHRWAERSLEEFKRGRPSFAKVSAGKQALFGIVQGGIFKELREKSSKFIGSLDFDGFGIGGSFGEKQMKQVLKWSLSGLPDEKPRHLLGIGKIDDIFIAVKEGIDLFDCVIPTREGRHGVLYLKEGKISVKKGIDSKSASVRKISRVFKKDKEKGQKLATLHNIRFYKNLFKEIRAGIKNGKLAEIEKEYYYYNNKP
jgi:queuine tRNA-ribosyltransferase/7-cyano-7-deazaguanine tRNA-ribosyltransferase